MQKKRNTQNPHSLLSHASASPREFLQQVLYLYMDIFSEQTTTQGLGDARGGMKASRVLYTVVINQRAIFKRQGRQRSNQNSTSSSTMQLSLQSNPPLFHPHSTTYFLPLQHCSSSLPLISPSHFSQRSSLSHCSFSYMYSVLSGLYLSLLSLMQ